MVVFFDIDGTLVAAQTQIIPPSAKPAISLLRQKGHLPELNTGRPRGHVDPRLPELDFAGMVCSCGMEVYLEGKPLLQARLPQGLCEKVRSMSRLCRMQVLYEMPDKMLVDGEFSTCPECQAETRRMIARGTPPVVQYDDEPNPEFIKLGAFDGPGCDKKRFLSFMEEYFECIVRSDTFVECVAKGYSKATGMDVLLRHLGLTRKDAVAIGDSMNDLSMFAAAGTTIAMGSCKEGLKPYASYITDTVLNDGIWKALKHYNLI